MFSRQSRLIAHEAYPPHEVRGNRVEHALAVSCGEHLRIKLSTTLVAAAVLLATLPVMSVANGQPYGNRHPYVGLAIQFIPSMPGFITLCSGSALSPTVFMTAAHCFDPTLPVLVTYKSAPPFSLANDFTVGTFYPHPDWCVGCDPGLPGNDTRDVAVIVLSAPRDPGAFATLPSAGLVGTLPTRTEIDLIGYGTQGFARGGGPPQGLITLTRYFAPSLIQSNHRHSAEFIKLTANLSDGKGGICFGDSGGPDILSGTDIERAVNTYVTNGNCAGVVGSGNSGHRFPEILATSLS